MNTNNQKFLDLKKTLKDEPRAFVDFIGYKTLWFNTGTLCNLECSNCYIESSPKNDSLVYLNKEDISQYLDELNDPKVNIGLTGGEPFLNPNIIDILNEILKRGHKLTILTNAYNVIKRWEKKLLNLNSQYRNLLSLRVSLDHHTEDIHEKERGKGTFKKTLESIKWLHDNHFNISIASRSLTHEDNSFAIEAHQELLNSTGIDLELNQNNIVIFPEMDLNKEVPEISVHCWDILKKSPNDQMCASERMIVKKKGESKCSVQACTLLAYQNQFNMGTTLEDAKKSVHLNHPFCAMFCVLGGASCSSTK